MRGAGRGRLTWAGMQDMEGGAEKMMENCIINVCQPGSSLLCAGYCLYSSATNFVLTIGKGTIGFTYDSMVGEFIMSHPNIQARCCRAPTPAAAHMPSSASCHQLSPVRCAVGQLRVSLES